MCRAVLARGRVRLTAADSGGALVEFETDHVVVGTGFMVDVNRWPFLDPSLTSAVRRVDRAPALSRHFETSVPGLYVIGPASAFSFGPLYRFVAGAWYTVPTIAKRLAATRSAIASVSTSSREQTRVAIGH